MRVEEERCQTGNCKMHLKARGPHMFDNTPVLMGQENHVGGSPLEVLGSILNEQISHVLGKQSYLATVSHWGLLFHPMSYHGGGRFFPSRVWPEHTMRPARCIEEAQECPQECSSQCLLTLVTAPLSDVDKDVLLGFTRFTPPGGLRGVAQDIATVWA